MSVQLTHQPIFFLTRSLHFGGAERQLVALVKGLAQKGHRVTVVFFYEGGEFEAELTAAGIPLISLNKTGRWDIIPFLIRLVQVHVKAQPKLIHSYLTVPNLLAVLLKPWLPNTRIVWGVRASNMDLSRYDWLSRLTYRVECHASCYADLIIANSKAGEQYAADNGFHTDKMTVIPNGIDTGQFCYHAKARQQMRAQWGVANEEILVGLVARLDPMKDHGNFIAAASLVVKTQPKVRFVCVGGGPVDYLQALKLQAESLGDTIIWAGANADMAAIYSALDIAVSASLSEGFSNTIAEAMACERPCVATDVGDSAWIIGTTGVLVPAANATLLAEGLLQLIELPQLKRAELGVQARLRVEQEFAVTTLITRTKQALDLT